MAQRLTTRFNALTRRHLERVFRLATGSPRQVLLSFLLIIALSCLSISTIRFETDIFRLFPARQPALRLLLESLEWSGSAGEAYFLLEGDKRSLPVEAQAFATRLEQAAIDGKPAFKRVTWKVYDEQQAASFQELISYAVQHPHLFIAPSDITSLPGRFRQASINASLQRLQSELAGQFAGSATALAAADPLYLRDLILPRLKAGSRALDLDQTSPYFLSRDGTLLIMIAEPARSVQDMVFARKLVDVINACRKGAMVTITCTGAHISAVLDEQAMKSNVLVSILSSLLVVLGIFYAAYRRFLPTMLIPLLLLCGVVLALGVAGLFVRSIHIISFAFTALITGIGTDYSIHLYDRFHTERARGEGTNEALRLAFLDTGHGVFTAAITTAIPFLALCVSEVRALSELGLLVGLGVVFSLYASLFFLPALLQYMEQRHPIVYRPIPGLALGRVWRLATGRPGIITALSVALVAALLFCAFKISFDGELKNLQPRHSEAFIAQERIEQHLSLAPKQMLVALEGQELQEVLARSARVGALAAQLRECGEIAAWSSLGGVINSPEAQEAAVRILKKQLSGESPAGKLRAAMIRQGFDPEGFTPFLAAIDRFGNLSPQPEQEAIERLAHSPLKGIVDRHLIHNADGYHALVYLYYHGAEFGQARFLTELKRLDPAARASSVDLVSEQLTSSVRESFAKAFTIGGILVVFLLLAHFAGSPGGLFYSLFPVLGGSVCMLGIMALCGMKLNFMNAMVLVTILGMGSDFGLYVRFRVRSEQEAERGREFAQIGRSVLLSALTTIVGFGSLAFTDYGAMSSIGWATNLGVGFTTLFSLVTIPAIMMLWRKRRKTSIN